MNETHEQCQARLTAERLAAGWPAEATDGAGLADLAAIVAGDRRAAEARKLTAACLDVA